ncbi:MAG: cadherin-like domain-containing protein [Geminicoccaceae bacterium]
MIALRQNLAGCGLALLLAGMAVPAAAESEPEPPASPTLFELLSMWLGLSDQPEDQTAPAQYQVVSSSHQPGAPDSSEDSATPDFRPRPQSWSTRPDVFAASPSWGTRFGLSGPLQSWSMRLGMSGGRSSPGPGRPGASAPSKPAPLPDFRPSQYCLGKVSSDFGAKPPGLGVEDSVRMDRAGRVKIDVKDLLENDLGWQCEHPCKLEKTNRLDLRAFAGADNIKGIVRKGKFIYVEADERRKKTTFTYQVFDKDTKASADVRVSVWFGNREPKTKRDKLAAFANTETAFEVADLLGNDRDRDGNLLDLVRVWCPKGGRVFMREVDGELKVFFQPDEGFTGVAYFKYTIADLSDPGDLLVAGPGAPSPERMTFAEGIVRVRVLASPS